MRRRSTLIFLVLLLLIGGGATAFYSHLRKQAVPDAAEVDAFLRHFPPASGWSRTWEPGTKTVSVSKRPSWSQSLNPFGAHDDEMIPAETYWFKRASPGYTGVVVSYESGSRKIDRIAISTDPPNAADAAEFQRLLLEKFPNLRHLLE